MLSLNPAKLSSKASNSKYHRRQGELHARNIPPVSGGVCSDQQQEPPFLPILVMTSGTNWSSFSRLPF